jgi:hypothetical protein
MDGDAGQVLGYLCMLEPEFDAESVFAKAAGQMKAKAGVSGTVKPLVLKEVCLSKAPLVHVAEIGNIDQRNIRSSLV